MPLIFSFSWICVLFLSCAFKSMAINRKWIWYTGNSADNWYDGIGRNTYSLICLLVVQLNYVVLTQIFNKKCLNFVCCVSYIALLITYRWCSLVFFQIVLFHSVNWLGDCAAWGKKKQNVFKNPLLTTSHEYDLATDEQNIHN